MIIVGRDADRAAAAADIGGVAVAADVADPAAVELILTRAADLPPLRGALLSVVVPTGTVLGTPDSEWRSGFDTVFLGPLRVARSLIERCDDLQALVWVLSSSAKSPIAGLSVSNGLPPRTGHAREGSRRRGRPRGIRVTAGASRSDRHSPTGRNWRPTAPTRRLAPDTVGGDPAASLRPSRGAGRCRGLPPVPAGLVRHRIGARGRRGHLRSL